MKIRHLLPPMLLWAAVAHGQTAVDTFNPLPSPGANFSTQLQTFLRNEDAQRFNDHFQSYIESQCMMYTAGAIGKVGTFTGTPCVAYPGGWRVSEPVASIDFSLTGATDNDVCWVAVHRDASGTVGSFLRVGSTHYIVDCSSATQPPLPANSAYAMKVTITGGAISSVVDLRQRSPISRSLFYSVRDFGALCDGATDDWPIIQAALDSIYWQGGGTLFFPADAICLIGAPLTVGSKTTLEGASIRASLRASDSFAGNYLVDFKSDSSPGLFGGMKNMTLKNRDKPNWAIHVDGWRLLKLDHLRILDPHLGGIEIHPTQVGFSDNDSWGHSITNVFVDQDFDGPSNERRAARVLLVRGGFTGRVTDMEFRNVGTIGAAAAQSYVADSYGNKYIFELRDANRIHLYNTWTAIGATAGHAVDASVAITEEECLPLHDADAESPCDYAPGSVAMTEGMTIIDHYFEYHVDETAGANDAPAVLLQSGRAQSGDFMEDNIVEGVERSPNNGLFVKLTHRNLQVGDGTPVALGNNRDNQILWLAHPTSSGKQIIIDDGVINTTLNVTGLGATLTWGSSASNVIQDMCKNPLDAACTTGVESKTLLNGVSGFDLTGKTVPNMVGGDGGSIGRIMCDSSGGNTDNPCYLIDANNTPREMGLEAVLQRCAAWVSDDADTAVTLCTARPQDIFVSNVYVDVQQAFDGSETLTVGTDGDPDGFMAAKNLGAQPTGIYAFAGGVGTITRGVRTGYAHAACTAGTNNNTSCKTNGDCTGGGTCTLSQYPLRVYRSNMSNNGSGKALVVLEYYRKVPVIP